MTRDGIREVAKSLIDGPSALGIWSWTRIFCSLHDFCYLHDNLSCIVFAEASQCSACYHLQVSLSCGQHDSPLSECPSNDPHTLRFAVISPRGEYHSICKKTIWWFHHNRTGDCTWSEYKHASPSDPSLLHVTFNHVRFSPPSASWLILTW